MNKKLLTGIFGFGISALLFVACGSGDIIPVTGDDEAALITAQEDYKKTEQGMEACMQSEECRALLSRPQSSSEQPSSSSTIEPLQSSSSVVIVQSSSSAVILQSSSSIVILQSSSSAVILQSSSSVGTPPPDGISCGPMKSPINKGGTATWNITGGGAAIINANFHWTFPDGEPGTAEGGLAVAFNPQVTYATSGSKTASLVIDHGAPITCSPLQVNGALITATCTPNKLQVDAALSETITYTVSASSAGATITGYTWTKATGTGETATFTPTEKGEVTGVSVEVSNDDNTIQSFNCPAVKVIDSSQPDYELTKSGTDIALPAGDVIVSMNLPADWHNGTEGTCTFYCQTQANQGAISGTVDGVPISGNYHTTVQIPITSTINGYALAVTLTNAATCGVNW